MKYLDELDDRERRIALAWISLEQKEVKKAPEKYNPKYPIVFLLCLIAYVAFLLYLAFD